MDDLRRDTDQARATTKLVEQSIWPRPLAHSLVELGALLVSESRYEKAVVAFRGAAFINPGSLVSDAYKNACRNADFIAYVLSQDFDDFIVEEKDASLQGFHYRG